VFPQIVASIYPFGQMSQGRFWCQASYLRLRFRGAQLYLERFSLNLDTIGFGQFSPSPKFDFAVHPYATCLDQLLCLSTGTRNPQEF